MMMYCCGCMYTTRNYQSNDAPLLLQLRVVSTQPCVIAMCGSDNAYPLCA